MASTYQRKDGSWDTVVNLGKGKKKHFGGKTPEQSKARMAEFYSAPIMPAPSVSVSAPATIKAARLDGPKYMPVPGPLGQSELVVILPDQQIPFHDRELHTLVCDWLAENKPDRMILSGDFYDFPSISKHPRKAHELRIGGVQECLDVGYQVARDYIDAAGPTCYDRKVVPGNHEFRLQKAILENMPEFHELHRPDERTRLLGLPHLGRWDELGFTWAADPIYQEDYPQGHVNITNNIAVYHGWLARRNAGQTALATLDHLGHSVIVGHTHRQAIVGHTYHEIDGTLRVLRAVEAGTLARVRGGLGYAVAPNWQPGFATVRVHPNGSFNVELATYVNGALLWGDQAYGRQRPVKRRLEAVA